MLKQDMNILIKMHWKKSGKIWKLKQYARPKEKLKKEKVAHTSYSGEKSKCIIKIVLKVSTDHHFKWIKNVKRN